jgi:hypothetical protein
VIAVDIYFRESDVFSSGVSGWGGALGLGWSLTSEPLSSQTQLAAQQSRTWSCATSDRTAFLNVAPRKGKEHGLGGSDPTMDGPRFGMSLVLAGASGLPLFFLFSPSIAEAAATSIHCRRRPASGIWVQRETLPSDK